LGDHQGLVGAAFFDLYQDPREIHGMMAQYLWAWGPFDMMKSRHEAQIAEYPFVLLRMVFHAVGLKI
jgi:arylsulfatase